MIKRSKHIKVLLSLLLSEEKLAVEHIDTATVNQCNLVSKQIHKFAPE